MHTHISSVGELFGCFADAHDVVAHQEKLDEPPAQPAQAFLLSIKHDTFKKTDRKDTRRRRKNREAKGVEDEGEHVGGKLFERGRYTAGCKGAGIVPKGN